ncbi:MAG: hypothetical protein E6G26_04175 [Actinobacteria bacterium]|nr:MAG: hypothetical protein E6G26_04175 [Actinomycetota bacterium]
MPRLKPKVGPLGLALTAWDIWRRLPPRQRKQILNIARKHGPRVAARVLRAAQTARAARAANRRR